MSITVLFAHYHFPKISLSSAKRKMTLPGGESNPALARSVGMTGACTNPIYYQGLHPTSNGHIVGSADHHNPNNGYLPQAGGYPGPSHHIKALGDYGRDDMMTCCQRPRDAFSSRAAHGTPRTRWGVYPRVQQIRAQVPVHPALNSSLQTLHRCLHHLYRIG